jgi:hypothetical protein
MNKPGNLQKHPDGYTIILERVYKHGINKVWGAITDPKKNIVMVFRHRVGLQAGG